MTQKNFHFTSRAMTPIMMIAESWRPRFHNSLAIEAQILPRSGVPTQYSKDLPTKSH